jgi:hypothetical protein
MLTWLVFEGDSMSPPPKRHCAYKYTTVDLKLE